MIRALIRFIRDLREDPEILRLKREIATRRARHQSVRHVQAALTERRHLQLRARTSPPQGQPT